VDPMCARMESTEEELTRKEHRPCNISIHPPGS
jgi:hypothetical protein